MPSGPSGCCSGTQYASMELLAAGFTSPAVQIALMRGLATKVHMTRQSKQIERTLDCGKVGLKHIVEIVHM